MMICKWCSPTTVIASQVQILLFLTEQQIDCEFTQQSDCCSFFHKCELIRL